MHYKCHNLSGFDSFIWTWLIFNDVTTTGRNLSIFTPFKIKDAKIYVRLRSIKLTQLNFEKLLSSQIKLLRKLTPLRLGNT